MTGGFGQQTGIDGDILPYHVIIPDDDLSRLCVLRRLGVFSRCAYGGELPDVVIVTDHNVLVQGPEDYYKNGDQRVLLLVGEEIHDQARNPQKNHLLVFGVEKELAPLASEPQALIDAVSQAGGIAFIAHPVDPEAPAVGEVQRRNLQLQGSTC